MDSTNETKSAIKKHPYLQVLELLAILTVFEVLIGIASIEKTIQVPILALLAFGKAYLVAAFFLGIKYENHPSIVTSVVFVIPLLIALPVAIMPMFD